MQNLPEPCRTEHLGGVLEINFYDQGNRYYGDYHRIKVLARIDVTLAEEHFRDDPDPAKSLARACRWLGKAVTFEKSLEKMGVSGADVSKVTTELIDNFLDTAGTYLSHPDFPRRFVQQELKKRQSRPSPVPDR